MTPLRQTAAAVRVLQVVTSLAPGGTERLVVELASRLSGRAQVAVCCLDEPGAWASLLEDRGVPVTALRRRPGFRPEVGRRLAHVVQSFGATAIHCHQYSPFIYGRLATLRTPRVRLVFTEHGRLSTAAPSWKQRLVNPWFASRGRLFAVSQELRDFLVHEARFPARMQVIHNGIEPGPSPSDAQRTLARQALQVDDSHWVAGTVARLDPVKDLDTLLAAFALVHRRQPCAVLVVAGDGPLGADLRALAARLGIAQAVRFLGSRDDARLLMTGFDAYVNTSVTEGLSVTILEAMAAGLPVIATAVGGTPEVVVDGVTGRLTPKSSPQDTAGALEQLIRHREQAVRWGKAGRARLVERFTLERMVSDYAREYGIVEETTL